MNTSDLLEKSKSPSSKGFGEKPTLIHLPSKNPYEKFKRPGKMAFNKALKQPNILYNYGFSKFSPMERYPVYKYLKGLNIKVKEN